jgi:MFS family permease
MMPVESRPREADRRRARWRMLVGIGVFWMGLYLYVPILTPDVTHATGSAGFAGLVVASYGVPQLLCRMTLAGWSDRLGQRRPFILAGLGLVALSSLGMALMPTGGGFLVCRTLAGLAASTWAMFSMQFAAQFPPDAPAAPTLARAMGLASFANNGGQVVAVLVGGLLAAWRGDAATFWASAAIAVVGILLTAPVGDPPRPAASGARFPWHRIVAHPDVAAAAALGILFQAGTFVTTFGYVPLWAARHGLPDQALGLLTAVSLVPAALTPVAAGSWAAARWRLEAILVAGFLLIALMTAAIPMAGAGVWLFVSQAGAGVGRGLVAPILMTMAVRAMPAAQRTSGLAAYQALYAAGMVAGPAAAAGLVGAVGLAMVFRLAAALSLAAAAAATALSWRAAHPPATPGGVSA